MLSDVELGLELLRRLKADRQFPRVTATAQWNLYAYPEHALLEPLETHVRKGPRQECATRLGTGGMDGWKLRRRGRKDAERFLELAKATGTAECRRRRQNRRDRESRFLAQGVAVALGSGRVSDEVGGENRLGGMERCKRRASGKLVQS